MRLRELAKSAELQSHLDRSIVDLAPPPLPGNKMTTVSSLAAKVAADRKAREAKVAAIATRREALSAKADAVLAQHESAMAAEEAELQELEASLNPDLGHNGGPA